MDDKAYKDWSIKETFWLAVTVYLMAMFMNGVANNLLSSIEEDADRLMFFSQTVSKLTIVGLLILLAMCKVNDKFLSYFKLDKQPQLTLALRYSFVIVLAVVLQASLNLTGMDISQELAEDEWYAENVHIVFLLIAIVGPIAEEFLYRGFLYQGWCEHSDRKYLGYLAISIIFALVHSNVYGLFVLVYIFFISMLLCHAREKSGSLTLPIYLHILHNSLAFLFIFSNVVFS